MGCFHFAVFLFYPVTDTQFFGKLFTILEFEAGFMIIIHTGYAIRVTFGLSDPAVLSQWT